MALPGGVTHVVFGGKLPSGEVWESGFWTHGANPTSQAVANELAGLWFAQLNANDSSGALRISGGYLFSSDLTWEYVRVYVYNSGGGAATFIGEHQEQGYYGNPSGTHPLQTCMVVSLRTASAGRAWRGRMYMPAVRATIGGDAQFINAQMTAMANGWATAFSDWNASGDNGTVVVCSRSQTATAPITSVIIDSRPDIQRRRANKQSGVFRHLSPLTS